MNPATAASRCPARPMQGAGFTIVELMAVIAVIGLLIALLMPAVSSFQKSSRAMVSQSNLRQWGVATIAFCAANDDLLPWEGFEDIEGMHVNFAEPMWWANAVPPFAGQPPYRTYAQTPGQTIPLPPDDSSIFVDPAALVPAEAPYMAGHMGDLKPFFFCYVPNLQLNNAIEAQWLATNKRPRMRLGSLSRSDVTILMLEMRTMQSELPADDPFFNYTLVRARADWKRLAARHRNGGHLLFADGHVAHADFKYATTNNLGTRNPEEPGADWNKTDLIWNPWGPALEDPGS